MRYTFFDMYHIIIMGNFTVGSTCRDRMHELFFCCSCNYTLQYCGSYFITTIAFPSFNILTCLANVIKSIFSWYVVVVNTITVKPVPTFRTAYHWFHLSINLFACSAHALRVCMIECGISITKQVPFLHRF